MTIEEQQDILWTDLALRASKHIRSVINIPQSQRLS
jgi:hypothetical protein